MEKKLEGRSSGYVLERIGFFQKNKFLLFLFLLLREPNIGHKSKICIFKKAGDPILTLWLSFGRIKYEKKAKGKKFREGTLKDRILSKKFKFYVFIFTPSR